MNEINTADLSTFGYRELDIAANLLKAYASGKSNLDFLGDGLTLNFNSNSGYVFLSDADFNVGVLDQGESEEMDRIAQFFSCPECGYEGTQKDAEDEDKDFEKHNGYCSQECEDKNK